ncbi:MAG: glycosyltransferase family 4 protein [Actinobacteria bacterium]|nr:glycosyltransferase family 4 protein [Actinomycetota bacterium]
MRVLLLSLLFEPDLSANSYAMSALATGLVERGHELTVLTAMPHYGAGRVYEGYGGRAVMVEHRPGMRVVRLGLYVPKRPDWTLGKVLSWASFNVAATPVAALLGRHDVAMTLPPPYTLGLTQLVVKVLRGIPYVYNVQDVYPDVAVQQGLVRDPRIVRALRAVEDTIYRHAALVTVISADIRDNLLAKGVPPGRVEVVPNCFETELVTPEPRENEFAARHGLSGRLVAMYAGNVGDSLGVESLCDAMRMLASRDDILFAVAGRGTALPRLRAMCEEARLPNVRFLPFQDRSTLSKLYASSDVQLMLQRRGLSQSSTPTKLLTIMSSGRPVIASVDVNSAGADVVRQATAGTVVEAEKPEMLADAIRALAANDALRAELGRAAREYVVRHYSKQAVAERYETVLRRAAGGRRETAPVRELEVHAG